MRKLIFTILIGLCLSVNLFAAEFLIQRPQADSIKNTTDTTRWIPIPADVDSVILLAQGKGTAANDSIIGWLDLCESDTANASGPQIWAKEISVLVNVGNATVNNAGTYGTEIAGFKYYRLIRYSNTATVYGRVWLLWVK
jgi:hypothetical protein